jgi:D-glycero-D-manno-heptose 1,7-bisphosphate phosphatase
MMGSGILLDRDGVVNELVVADGFRRSPRTIEEFKYHIHFVDFIARIRAMGYPIGIVTNQPEVKRGLVSREIVDSFHEKIKRDFGIRDVFVCWHDNEDLCGCRKPRPGLLLTAANAMGLELAHSFFVGDRVQDMTAAKAAGCNGILLSDKGGDGNIWFPDLLQIADYLEAQRRVA